MPAWATSRRHPRPNWSGTLAALVAVALIAAVAWLLSPDRPDATPVEGAAQVVDGDTLDLGTVRIRLAGIDAPEAAQTCGEADLPWPCGAAAVTALRDLVHGENITCTPLERDRYGRLVARCMAGGIDLAREMVGQGLAVADGAYVVEETGARVAGIGLWQGPFQRPAEWRADHAQEPAGGSGNPSRLEQFFGWRF